MLRRIAVDIGLQRGQQVVVAVDGADDAVGYLHLFADGFCLRTAICHESYGDKSDIWQYRADANSRIRILVW